MPLSKILLTLISGLLLIACHHPSPDISDSWDLTNERRDSINFAQTHHYSQGFNFAVNADSIILLSNPPTTSWKLSMRDDSVVVYCHDRLVVADVMVTNTNSSDSVWIKVARDQETMGWASENVLLKSATPDYPISKFIHSFSNHRLLLFVYVMGLVALYYLYRAMRHKRFRLVHFNDIESFYPTLLCLLVSGTATLYALMQHHLPEMWQYFYFHPTLNPFGLPFILSAFVSAVWLLVIVSLAALDDVRKQLDRNDAFSYLLGLICTCGVLYIFFTLAITRYLGTPLFIAYVAFALYRYLKFYAARYVCGECGAAMHNKGRCTRCGKTNH